MKNLLLGTRALDALGIDLFDVTGLLVGLFEVEFPTFTRSLRVRLSKLHVNLKQRQLPKVVIALRPAVSAGCLACADLSRYLLEFPRAGLSKRTIQCCYRALQYCPPEASDKANGVISSQLKVAKLAAVEKLLWGNEVAKDASDTAAGKSSYQQIVLCYLGWLHSQNTTVQWSCDHAGAQKSRFKARMLHRTLAFAVQYIELSASDLQVTFSQQDEPGPVPTAGIHLEGKDSLQLSFRQLSLMPLGEGRALEDGP